MTYEVVEEGLEHAHVLGVRDEPVERREVLALRQLLVQAPEHLSGGGGAVGVMLGRCRFGRPNQG